MQASEAMDLINGAIWRPGLKVRATDRSDPYAIGYGYYDDLYPLRGTIYVTVDWKAMDSSHPDEHGNYTREIDLGTSTEINVAYKSEEEVLYAVVKFIGQLSEHEDREFVRVRRNGQWVAPLHPHRYDGESAWNSATRTVRVKPLVTV